MPKLPVCGKCGAPLDLGAADGLCPTCLFKDGLGLLASGSEGATSVSLETPGTRIGPYKLLQLTLDGETLMDESNAMQYFSQIPVEPPIPGDFYSIIWFQGIGVVHTPLTPGAHTLRLDAKNTLPIPPNFGAPVFEVHNTWNITVRAGQ